jgi:hypothetical protein
MASFRPGDTDSPAKRIVGFDDSGNPPWLMVPEGEFGRVILTGGSGLSRLKSVWDPDGKGVVTVAQQTPGTTLLEARNASGLVRATNFKLEAQLYGWFPPESVAAAVAGAWVSPRRNEREAQNSVFGLRSPFALPSDETLRQETRLRRSESLSWDAGFMISGHRRVEERGMIRVRI